MKKYSTADLKLIAHALDTVSRKTGDGKGADLNMFHLGRFSNRTHYIDYNERLKKVKCYKKEPEKKLKITKLPDGSAFAKMRIGKNFNLRKSFGNLNPLIHTK